MMQLKEKKSLLAALALVSLLYLPTLNYPETDDAVSYAILTNYFVEGEKYATPAHPRLPVLSILSIPLSIIAGKYVFGVKLTVFVLGMLSLIVWFYIGREFFGDTKIFPLLFLSPYLILHSAFRGLAESPLILFSLLSVFFYLKAEKNKKYYYLSGFFFGLASLSRYSGITLGIAYLIMLLFDKKKLSRAYLLSIALGFFMFSLFFINNYINTGSLVYPAYVAMLTGETSGGILPRFYAAPKFFAVLLLFSSPFYIYHFFKGIKRENLLFLVLIVVGVTFASYSGQRYRYLAPIIPFVLIVVYEGFRSSGKMKYLLILGIVSNIMIIPYLTNGYFKNFADSIYATPPVWGQVGLMNEEAVEWINDNLPQNSVLVIRHNPFWSEYIRGDITAVRYLKLKEIEAGEIYLLYDYNFDIATREYVDKNFKTMKIFEGPLKIEVYKAVRIYS